jgi:plasmid stabilization system protein ParE
MSIEQPYGFKPTETFLLQLDDILEIYNGYGVSAVDKFEGTLNATIDLLESFPEASTALEGIEGVRYKSIPKYPFIMYFRLDHGNFEIIAFALHSSRQDPKLIEHQIKQAIFSLTNQTNQGVPNED